MNGLWNKKLRKDSDVWISQEARSTGSAFTYTGCICEKSRRHTLTTKFSWNCFLRRIQKEEEKNSAKALSVYYRTYGLPKKYSTVSKYKNLLINSTTALIRKEFKFKIQKDKSKVLVYII